MGLLSHIRVLTALMSLYLGISHLFVEELNVSFFMATPSHIFLSLRNYFFSHGSYGIFDRVFKPVIPSPYFSGGGLEPNLKTRETAILSPKRIHP